MQLQRKQSDRTREIPLSECHLLELSQTQSSEMPASWSMVNKNNSLNRLMSSSFRRCRHPDVTDGARSSATGGYCVKNKPISFSLSVASEATATVPENGCIVRIIRSRNDCGSEASSQVYWGEIKDLLQDKTCIRAILRARLQLRICGKQTRHTEARRIVCFCQIRMTRSLPNIFSSSSNAGMLDVHFCTSINVYRRVLSSFDVSRFTSRGREKI